MDQLRYAELDFRMQHRHRDGSWATLERRPPHHSPADHDPERDWASGVIYECTTCEEFVRVAPREDKDLPR